MGRLVRFSQLVDMLCIIAVVIHRRRAIAGRHVGVRLGMEFLFIDLLAIIRLCVRILSLSSWGVVGAVGVGLVRGFKLFCLVMDLLQGKESGEGGAVLMGASIEWMGVVMRVMSVVDAALREDVKSLAEGRRGEGCEIVRG
jgi:hypothetical protein